MRSGLEAGFQHSLISCSTPVQIRPPQLTGWASVRQWFIPTADQVRLLDPALTAEWWKGRHARLRSSCSLGRGSSILPSATEDSGLSAVGSKDRPSVRADCRLPPADGPLACWSRGSRARIPGPHPGDDGSTPSGITAWSAGVAAARLFGREEDRVRAPGGPVWGRMCQGGEALLQRACDGFDPHRLHSFQPAINSNGGGFAPSPVAHSGARTTHAASTYSMAKLRTQLGESSSKLGRPAGE